MRCIQQFHTNKRQRDCSTACILISIHCNNLHVDSTFCTKIKRFIVTNLIFGLIGIIINVSYDGIPRIRNLFNYSISGGVSDISCHRTNSGIPTRILYAILSRSRTVVCRCSTIRNICICLKSCAVSILPSNSICSRSSAISGVNNSICCDVLNSTRIICRSIHLLIPTNSSKCILCCLASARNRRSRLLRYTIKTRYSSNRGTTIPSLICKNRRNMICRYIQIRIVFMIICKSFASQRSSMNCTRYLSGIHIISLFIKTSHLIKSFNDIINLIRIFTFPVESNDTNSCVVRN